MPHDRTHTCGSAPRSGRADGAARLLDYHALKGAGNDGVCGGPVPLDSWLPSSIMVGTVNVPKTVLMAAKPTGTRLVAILPQ